MRERIAAVAAALAVCLFADPAPAQQAKKFDLADTITVVSVDTDTRLVRVADTEGSEIDVLVDAQTEVLRGSDAIPIEELARGDRVVVEARRELEGPYDGDELVADRVSVVVDKPDEHDATPDAP